MIRLELGGAGFRLDPAAVSAVRYRARYGESPVAALARCRDGREEERLLLRVCHMMIPAADRPELPEFARLCRRDGGFLPKARQAAGALLSADPRMPRTEDAPAKEVDEYELLALMAAARVDMGLIYELPLFHLVSVVNRLGILLDPDRKEYRPMTREERSALYPRKKRGAVVSSGVRPGAEQTDLGPAGPQDGLRSRRGLDRAANRRSVTRSAEPW